MRTIWEGHQGALEELPTLESTSGREVLFPQVPESPTCTACTIKMLACAGHDKMFYHGVHGMHNQDVGLSVIYILIFYEEAMMKY